MVRLVPIAHHVHVGRDGWLFLIGGRNRPLAIYRRSLARTWRLRRWAALIGARERRFAALGCRYLHLPVPEKLSVYGDMARLGLDPSLSLARGLAALADPATCLDVTPALIAGRATAETFLRMDSHWTSAGCRIVHDAVCRAAGAPLRWSLEDRPVALYDTPGDLGSKLDPPTSEIQHRREVTRDARRVHANALLAHYERLGHASHLHRGAEAVFRNDAADADPRRLLVFGDSFSHFVGYMLTAMLAETFREVHFVWSVAIDWGYVERVKPDLVLTEIAERFMAWMPRDGFDLDSFAADKLARGDPAVGVEPAGS